MHTEFYMRILMKNAIYKTRYKCKDILKCLFNTEDRNVRTGLSWLGVRSSGAFSEHNYDSF